MVTITEVGPEVPCVDLEKLKRDARNLRRRERNHEAKAKRAKMGAQQIDPTQLIADAIQQGAKNREYAEEQSQQMLRDAALEGEKVVAQHMHQCARIEVAAKTEALKITSEAHNQVAELCQRRDVLQKELAEGADRKRTLAQSLSKLQEALKRSRVDLQSTGHTADNDRVHFAQLAREKDAARKQATYRERVTQRGPTVRASSIRSSRPSSEVNCAPANKSLRSIQRVAFDVISTLFNRMDKFNFAAKKEVLQRLWTHNALKEYQPTVHGCPKLDAPVGTAVNDLIKTLSTVKTARLKDHLSTKRALRIALVGESTVSRRYQSRLAKALGVERQNLYKASTVRKLLDEDASARYPSGQRKVRSDKISDEVRQIVQGFWESNTRISPCKKDVARLRVGVKQHEKHSKHWLEETEVEFFLKFQDWCAAENNNVSIGLRSFQVLKPYYIRTMKDRMVCCCKYHVEMDLLKEALNKFRRHHHTRDCTCDCSICRSDIAHVIGSSCEASKSLVTSVRGWMEHAVCKKPEGQEWHSRKCIYGACKSCGVQNLVWCPYELDKTEQHDIHWDTFEYVELDEKAQAKRERKKGTAEADQKKLTRQRLVHKTTSFPEFKLKVEKTMKFFLIHNFRARWQAEQSKLCLKSFPRGVIVSSIDFSENYSFQQQNEIQTQHWDNKQVTLLIHVTYRHREDVESEEAAVGRSISMAQDDTGTRDVIADYQFYISDDNQHDTLMVQHCLDSHARWMKEQKITFNQHWVWSDGAASQFKSCRPFYYVSRYYRRHGARMKWFFHGTGHGKGVADALGGHVKSTLEKEQLKGGQGACLENAHDVVLFCKDKFALHKEKEYGDVQDVRRLFWEIGKEEVNRKKKWDCDPIEGSRKLHCFDGFSPTLSTLLQVRELSCFCPHCIDDESNLCENVEWTGRFRLEMVKGILPADVRPELESMGVGEGIKVWSKIEMAEIVQLGDFYAVKASLPNNWDAEFYVLQWEETLHTVKKSFTDGYQEKFRRGSKVLKGRWYQALPRSAYRFLYNDKAPVSFNHARHVVHVKFPLRECESSRTGKNATRVYALDADTVFAITESLNPSLA